MKPAFLDQIDKAIAIRQHIILDFNTQDRYYWPEGEIRPCNLIFFLAQYFSQKDFKIAQYIPAMGFTELTCGQQKNKSSIFSKLGRSNDPTKILNDIFKLLRHPDEKWIVLIQYGEHLASSPDTPSAGGESESVQAAEILHQIALDDEIATGSSRVALITFEGMPSGLLSRSPAYRSISVGLPIEEERDDFVKFIENLRASGRSEFGELEKGLTPEELTRVTAGMPLLELEGLYREAGHFKKPVCRADVREAKSRAIRQLARDLLQVSEPQDGFDQIAGLKTLKHYFIDLLIPQIREGRPAPQAILLHGVPGCGKSHVVQAIACELGWPLLEMRNIHGPLVGQSEQQLERVIAVVEQLSPCVLFFDEIDQLLGQRGTGVSGDSGTSERMMARIFNWLGSMHLRGRVLFIGASNRPDILDPALLDRFRVSIPVLKPQRSEISELVPIFLERFERELTDEINTDKAIDLLSSLQPSGRSLQEIIIQAGLIADSISGAVGSKIDEGHLLDAAKDHLTAEDPLEIEFIRLTSLNLCSAQSLLPWNTINGMQRNVEIPADLIEDNIVSANGFLNIDELNEKLSLLRQKRQHLRAMR